MNFINNLIKKENEINKNSLEKPFEKGEFDKTEYLVRLEKKIRRNMNIRTVQRWVAKLIEEDILECKNNKYFLSQMAKSDIRYFGKRFGITALFHILDNVNDELKPIKDNLQNLITVFGAYLVFCCIEGARPSKKSHNMSSPVHRSDIEQLELAAAWMNGAVNPSTLFYYFLQLFRNQVDDETIQKIKKIKFVGLKDGKHIYVDEKTGQEYNQYQYVNANGFLYVYENGEIYNPRPYQRIPVNDEFIEDYLDKYPRYIGEDAEPPYHNIDYKTYNSLVNAFSQLQPELKKKLERKRHL